VGGRNRGELDGRNDREGRKELGWEHEDEEGGRRSSTAWTRHSTPPNRCRQYRRYATWR